MVRRAGDVYPPARIDLARLRVALTPDFGFAPTERAIADVLAEKTGLFRHVFARAEDATPDCADADETFEVLRSLGYLTNHLANVRTRPEDVGPNVTRNVEEGLRYSAQDVSRAQARQTAYYRRWQAFFEDYDLILSPAITVSPRPWTELYPAEIDGNADADLLPLAGAGLRRDAGRPPGDLAAGRAGSRAACRSACRSSARAAATRWCSRSPRRSRLCWPTTPAPRARCPTSPG